MALANLGCAGKIRGRADDGLRSHATGMGYESRLGCGNGGSEEHPISVVFSPELSSS
jgi:hypothetical protein